MQKRSTLAIFSVVLTLAAATSPVSAQTHINTRPTLGNIEDQVVRASDAIHYVELRDISPGTELDQEARISFTTTSDVIDVVEVDATSNGNAYLKFRTSPDVSGKAVVTITVKDNGQNPQSITRTFTITVIRPERQVVDNPTIPSVTTTKKIATLSTYPNPTIGPSRITFSTVKSERTVLVETFNAFGAKTHQLFNGSTEAGQLYSVPFERKGLTPGVYMIRLTSSEGMQQTRLLLTR